MACHPASQAAIAQPPPLPYQDNELHLGPLYELTLRTFSAAKRGPCASDGQRECDAGPGCGARTAENREKKKKQEQNILWLSSSTIVLRNSLNVCCGTLQFCRKIVANMT